MSHCRAPVPVLPAHGGRGGGGCAALGGEGDHPVLDPGPVSSTPDPEQQPLAAPVPTTLCCPRSCPAAPCCPCSLRGGEAPGPYPARSRPTAPCCSRSREEGRSLCVPSASAAAVSVAEMEPKTSARLARPRMIRREKGRGLRKREYPETPSSRGCKPKGPEILVLIYQGP